MVHGSKDEIDTFICEEMSRFGNWKNSGIPPTTKLPLLLLHIANVTISKEKDFVFNYYYFF